MNRELLLSSIACNGVFALEYYLLGEENKENLLHDGIEYCELIEDAAYESPVFDINKEEEKFEKITTIQKYYTHEKLIEYMNLAMEIRDNLGDILQGNKVTLSEEKIRSYQHFFNETSHIFLAGEMKKMQMLHELRLKLWS
jgi:hypothetical protein